MFKFNKYLWCFSNNICNYNIIIDILAKLNIFIIFLKMNFYKINSTQ